MAKTMKVMDICEGGCHLEVIKIMDRKERNPYRIRRVWHDYGCHVAQIASYGDWMSVIYFLRDFYLDGVDTMTTAEMKEWWRKGFGE